MRAQRLPAISTISSQLAHVVLSSILPSSCPHLFVSGPSLFLLDTNLDPAARLQLSAGALRAIVAGHAAILFGSCSSHHPDIYYMMLSHAPILSRATFCLLDLCLRCRYLPCSVVFVFHHRVLLVLQKLLSWWWSCSQHARDIRMVRRARNEQNRGMPCDDRSES